MRRRRTSSSAAAMASLDDFCCRQASLACLTYRFCQQLAHFNTFTSRTLLVE